MGPGGTAERAQSLGFALDEFVLPEYRPSAIRRILIARGITGILFAPPTGAKGARISA